MATQSPVFPMPEPHHFSDYGFDPQIDYFQVLEESKRHNNNKREHSCYSRSIDTLHFKLQKPISKDDLSKKKNKKNKSAKKRRWWKSTLLFFKSRWAPDSTRPVSPPAPFGPTSISGPIYITESLSTSGSATPPSGPLKGAIEIPYVSLRELNMDHQHMPIYLVS